MRRKTESYINSEFSNKQNLEKKYAAQAETIQEEEQKTPKYEQALKKLKNGEGFNRNNRIKLLGRLNDSAGAVSEITRTKNNTLSGSFANFKNIQQKIIDLQKISSVGGNTNN